MCRSCPHVADHAMPVTGTDVDKVGEAYDADRWLDRHGRRGNTEECLVANRHLHSGAGRLRL